jgi:cob(I)alamin adenosyltransferase
VQGYLQVYTGNGKGKTTAAFGLVLRAAGRGLRSYVGQFMKGRSYGEKTALADHPLIEIEMFGGTDCIRKDEVTPAHVAMAQEGLRCCRKALVSGRFDVVVADEILVTAWFGMLTEEEVLSLCQDRPANAELVLTGRYATPAIVERADLVTEMLNVRHYYDKGVQARVGIET